jgi:hypothetical protein
VLDDRNRNLIRLSTMTMLSSTILSQTAPSSSQSRGIPTDRTIAA